METFEEEWNELSKEFETLQGQHQIYTRKIEDVKEDQQRCLNAVKHQFYRMKQLTKSLKNLKDPSLQERVNELRDKMAARKNELRDVNDTLPKENGLYLSIVLGQVNVSLLSKRDKFAYKQDYERFKLVVTMISLVFSIALYGLVNHRVFDAAYHFLLLWYYCTLTIREQILITNGSRIKGWWLTHHFITTIVCGILVTWPITTSYHAFRDQFMLFSLYLNCVQVLQFYYQRGTLYKMRAMGKRHNMDITVDGFMSWMLRNLIFLLPFLFVAYLFQFYNAYTLYQISRRPDCHEWQVTALAALFLTLSVGNMFTTLQVVMRKLFMERFTAKYFLPTKYRFNRTSPP
jgi:hypothetical protein